MKISSIHVEGFGVWSQLRVEGFGEGLNVIYGPNEAGKTTLLEFVRSVLYGFSNVWGSYLPPLRSARAGGWLEVSTRQGVFRIQRLLNEQDMLEAPAAPCEAPPEGGGTDEKNRLGRLRILGPQGTVEEGRQLASLLGGVDEAIYQNIFAIGLREIQQLGLLSNTEAARLLYALSAGVDRVSLVQVMRELQAARHRLLAPGKEPCQLGELLARQEKLREELLAAHRTASQYPHLLTQRDQADQESHRLQTQLDQLQRQRRLVETALGVRDRLERRGQLDAQLAALSVGKPVSAEMLQQFETLTQSLSEHQAQTAVLRTQSEALREQLARLKVEEPLIRCAPRIHALAEQIPWITSLEERMLVLREEMAALEAKLSEHSQELGLQEAETWEQISSERADLGNERTWSRVREPAARIRQLRRKLQEAQQRAATAQQTAQSLQEQLQQALADRGYSDLASALGQTSERLAQLHRYQEIDKQITHLQRRQEELAEQAQGLIHRQVRPVGELIGWGALFVVGVVLVLWGGILPGVGIGSLNLLTAGLGMAALIGSVFGKIFLEQHRRQQFQTCSRQRKLLESQDRQLQEERRSLEATLSLTPGTLAPQMEQLQQELTWLEQLTPLDTRRQAADREAELAEEHRHHCQDQLHSARKRWEETLEVLGLPTTLSPTQVRKLQERAERLVEVHQRLDRCRQEYAQHQQQWEQLRERIREVAAEVNLGPTHLNPIELVRRLKESLSEQEALRNQRREVRRQLRTIQKQQRRCRRTEARLALQRRKLLRQAAVATEEAFRRRALETAQAEQIAQERQGLQREIEAILAGTATEEELAPYLERSNMLENQQAQLAAQIDQLSQQLQACYERRGRVNEQLRQLADDRTLAQKRLQWVQLQRQLDEAIHHWQVLALTSQLLNRLRIRYEREHQPETLQEASEYFAHLTEGRYARVWRPLDGEELRVDLADGHSLPVERLSQGTRELMFLSLRLALVSAYGRRGVQLPMILDDVMVNFDTSRSRTAAALLRDFALQGHQVLVFTCHDHLRKLFRELRVPQAVLPDWGQTPLPRVVLEIPCAEKKVRRKPTRPEPLEPKPEEKLSSEEPAGLPEVAQTHLEPSERTPDADEDVGLSDMEEAIAEQVDVETSFADSDQAMPTVGPGKEEPPPDGQEDFQWHEALTEEQTEENSHVSRPQGENEISEGIQNSASGRNGQKVFPENLHTSHEQHIPNQRRDIRDRAEETGRFEPDRFQADRQNSVSSWETDLKRPTSARPGSAEAA